MEFKGQITKILPVRTGQGARGQWVSQSFVLTYDTYNAEHPKSICFEVFGSDKLQEFRLSLNEQIVCQLDFEAREYNGKTFNSVRCWKVERPQMQQLQAQQPVQQPQQAAAPQGCQPYYPNQQPAQTPTQAPQQAAYVPTQQPAYVPPQPQASMQQPAAAADQGLPF